MPDINLRLFVAAVFMLQGTGCLHTASEQKPAQRKSSTVEKQAPSSPTSSPGPARIEPSEKPKTVEKKAPAMKEKKPAVSAEKGPDRKQGQADETNPDIFVPPPPTKPPTFGGAGG
jgi:hypothetical protein